MNLREMYVKFSSVCRDLNICFSSVLRNKHLVPSPKECFVCNTCFFPAWAPLIGFTGYSFEVCGDSVILHHRRFKICVGHSGKIRWVNLADNCETFSSEQNYEWMGFWSQTSKLPDHLFGFNWHMHKNEAGLEFQSRFWWEV